MLDLEMPPADGLHAAREIRDWRSVTDARRRGMDELIAALNGKQQLQAGLTTARATDLLFVLHSPETFLGLTRDNNSPLDEYKAWLYTALCQQLVTHPSHADPDTAAATRDLSFHHLIDG